MAVARPLETVYAPSRRKPATRETAVCIGRACTTMGAIRGACSKLNERAYVRADIYSVYTGVHLYTVLRQDGGLVVLRVKGERL